MSFDSKKRLSLAIIDFLNKSTTDGTLGADEKESIEIATQCIADAFKVDPSDSAAVSDALGGQSLLSIYGVFEKMKKSTPKPAAAAPKPSTPTAGPSVSDADKKAGEELKAQGNSAMSNKDFHGAIDFYTQALEKVPNNPIYLSNRAAAYNSIHEFDKAALDAQIAVDTDPKYTKAWSRLANARFSKGDARGAMEAYEAGIEAEGNGGSDIMRRGLETARKKVEEEEAASDSRSGAGSPSAGGEGGMPDLGGLASMLGGGGGGGGGMPDLGGLMNNPMFAQMAQKVMSNPGMLEGMMNNPMLKKMMDGAGGQGGGMPDMASLMQDPALMDMAKNFMGGGGSPGGAGRGAGTPP